MGGRILHVLSQRPSRTGSGVTLDALVRHALASGWEQHAVVGVPPDEPEPVVGGLPPDRIHPLVFGSGDLDFPLPGMSDVMPYPSSCFSRMSTVQLGRYREGWRRHLAGILDDVQPDLVHANHVWILASMIKDIAPGSPVVNHCHSTGLRQMVLCPHLADEVKAGCSRNDHFVVQHGGVAKELARALRLPPDRVTIVGAGYRDDLFHARGRHDGGHELVYAGKYSAAKGLPWLLDAVERVRELVPDLRLHVAGSGSGEEAAAIEARMRAMHPAVVMHGPLTQPELAVLMRRCAVCVMPSFYEGVPLVLVEARACGCRLVSTRLPGVMEQLAPRLGDDLELVSLPRLRGADEPEPLDLPAFVEDLTEAIGASLKNPPPAVDGALLQPFTWGAVFRRVEIVWNRLVAD